ncbi:copper resistance protein NlpE [Psychroflexus lacisalsi]|uniref:Copper resistance protein NlpE N-terminal domain-containing protein n=1 Tax=Psychroflexus lacisalsi TaxID=503928 RepID=A0ABN1K0J3_9FLAO|nr:copper resistance protein NlpE [Psychroflexus lacisalsi]MBZ9620919.1 copper resistance protein NlpE [Psychroflexus lacisalsi]
MMLRPYCVCLILFAFISCKNNTEANVELDIYVLDESFKEEHTSQNSLDWEGTYQGILPCADCEGIETKIQLKSNNTYIKSIKYLGKDEKEDQSQGNFSWNASGSEITLESEERPNTYKVMENAMMALDREGHLIRSQIEGDYKLKKDLE